MSHYEERLEKDVAALRERMWNQSVSVREALKRATTAFLDVDRPLASQVILGDHPVNREAKAIDQSCHAFVARHVPSAGHLRFVSAVMRMNIALERLGDYAVTICREAGQMQQPPPDSIIRDIEMMSDHGQRVLGQAMEAFRKNSADMARATLGLASQEGRAFHNVFTDLLTEGEKGSRSIEDLFGLLVVLYRLARVGDQTKNLCEETIFAATGEVKKPKVYSILFIDEKNDRWSQMAEAVARKAFPESGKYASAGWAPASEVDPRMVEFLDGQGLDIHAARPRKLDTDYYDLADYHVIVSLQGDPWARIPDVPFHTVLLGWDPIADPEATNNASLEDAQKRLSHEIQSLMETLRGEGAR